MGTFDREAAKHFQIIDYDYEWNTINTDKDIIAFGWRNFLLFGKLSMDRKKFYMCEDFDDYIFNVYNDPDWDMCIDTVDMDGHQCTYMGLAERV